jgi:anti-anti-sigma factor
MDVSLEERGEIVIIRVKGRLDAASSPQLQAAINTVIDGGHFKILLNFSDVDYLSSAGMRLLLAVSKKLGSLEGKVVACNLSDDVMEVIKMAGFDKVIEFYPNEAESLAHL